MNWRRTLRRHRKALVTAASGVLYAVGWGLGYATDFDAASAALLVTAAVVGGYDVARVAVHEVRSRTLGIKTLVTLAAVGAVAIGEYWEAAAVVFLFSLGGYLESRTMRKTRTALTELLERAPETALVRRDGDYIEVPARDVDVGEVVLVRPGATVPVDGEVVDGETAVDQSPVTGESAPQFKEPGDEVYAGTINRDGAVEVRTTGSGADTTLQRIVRRVEEAQEATAPTQRLLDRFARYYTPAVVALAVVAFVVTRDALLALTFLVVGCPGALVVGPPVSLVSAIGNAARKGVLLKGGEHLETAAAVDLVAFDKTGTLTRGETAVTDVRRFDHEAPATGGADDGPTTPGDVLRLAATAEKRSEHHLAGAILAAAREGDSLAADGGESVEAPPSAAEPAPAATDAAPIPDPDDFDVVPGKGVVASADGHEILVGNRALVADRDLDVPAAAEAYVRDREAAGETAVHVGYDGRVVGAVALRDEVREAAPAVVAALRDDGVRTVMLTGDTERTARAVAGAVGVDETRADLLPEDKQASVREFQAAGHVVAMVGDGINDAPSLATADVGIAMGAAGTDTAIETADVALMADDLRRIPEALALSEATRRNLYENVAVAVATVVVLLAAVATDAVHLAGGMLVHEGSVLFVVLNGMRLLRH